MEGYNVINMYCVQLSGYSLLDASQESLGTRLGCFHFYLCLSLLSPPTSHHCAAGWSGCWEQQGRQPDQEEGHSTGLAGGLQKHLWVLYPDHMSGMWCHMSNMWCHEWHVMSHECHMSNMWCHMSVTWVACDVTWPSVEDRLESSVLVLQVQFLVFLDHLPVISTELLTTYMLPGLNSVLRDMETLDAEKVVCRQLHLLLPCYPLVYVPMFQTSLPCSSSLETVSPRWKSTRNQQLGMLS